MDCLFSSGPLCWSNGAGLPLKSSGSSLPVATNPSHPANLDQGLSCPWDPVGTLPCPLPFKGLGRSPAPMVHTPVLSSSVTPIGTCDVQDCKPGAPPPKDCAFPTSGVRSRGPPSLTLACLVVPWRCPRQSNSLRPPCPMAGALGGGRGHLFTHNRLQIG